jgi:hypothetical protein
LLNVFDGVDLMTTSDGSTASYYELPKGCTELQDLISHRNLNAQDGEIFRAIYRKGMASHSDTLRDAKKVLFYATAEVKRLELARDIAAGYDQVGIDSVAFSPKPSPAFAEKIKAAEVADNDGWIDWAGGECPVADGLDYELKFGDGSTQVDDEPNAYAWDEDFAGCHADTVVSYRIHKAGE